jgi:TM2 domain-containing membrane protein YozV
LAFPFPFGIVGLHRIYLGTSPHVPVVYIGTLGGVLGILPFIDFCVLILDKDFDRYIENKKVFMWVN